MSMRITNKIMTNNSLVNINNNKNLQDQLNSQINTGKKISRPSDDPVIAIRALRLRSGLSDVEQYLGKNVEDADCWIQTTEDTIKTAGDILEDIRKQCEKGAQDTNQTVDRNAILEQISSLRDEFYATGDADYAGRQLFTGYRTSTPLTFQEAKEQNYTIYEASDKNDLQSFTYIGTQGLENITEGNYESAFDDGGVDRNYKETDVYEATLHRIMLSYDNLDSSATGVTGDPVSDVGLTYKIKNKDYDPTNPTSKEYLTIELAQIKADGDGLPYISPSSGKAVTIEGDEVDNGITVISKYADPNPYELMAKHGRSADTAAGTAAGAYANCAILIPETGELLLGEDLFNVLSTTNDNSETNKVDEGKIEISYNKTNWNKGDVNPVHYFACVEDNGTISGIAHNWELRNDEVWQRDIEYDVGNNQSIKVNTNADEVFDLGVGRVVDNLINIINEVDAIEKIYNKFKERGTSDEASESEKETYEAAKKALDMANKKMQEAFGSAMTSIKEYYNQSNQALTDVGTRSARVELVKNRLTSQKSNFRDLVSDNEQIDVTEAAINLASAELTYNASLMATGKIAQTSLMNYI